MKIGLLCMAMLLVLPAAVLADQASAAACSAGLSSDAKLIYDKTAPTVNPATVIKDALTAVVRPMVMNGSMTQAVARPAAEAAGECLKLLK